MNKLNTPKISPQPLQLPQVAMNDAMHSELCPFLPLTCSKPIRVSVVQLALILSIFAHWIVARLNETLGNIARGDEVAIVPMKLDQTDITVWYFTENIQAWTVYNNVQTQASALKEWQLFDTFDYEEAKASEFTTISFCQGLSSKSIGSMLLSYQYSESADGTTSWKNKKIANFTGFITLENSNYLKVVSQATAYLISEKIATPEQLGQTTAVLDLLEFNPIDFSPESVKKSQITLNANFKSNSLKKIVLSPSSDAKLPRAFLLIRNNAGQLIRDKSIDTRIIYFSELMKSEDPAVGSFIDLKEAITDNFKIIDFSVVVENQNDINIILVTKDTVEAADIPLNIIKCFLKASDPGPGYVLDTCKVIHSELKSNKIAVLGRTTSDNQIEVQQFDLTTSIVEIGLLETEKLTVKFSMKLPYVMADKLKSVEAVGFQALMLRTKANYKANYIIRRPNDATEMMGNTLQTWVGKKETVISFKLNLYTYSGYTFRVKNSLSNTSIRLILDTESIKEDGDFSIDAEQMVYDPNEPILSEMSLVGNIQSKINTVKIIKSNIELDVVKKTSEFTIELNRNYVRSNYFEISGDNFSSISRRDVNILNTTMHLPKEVISANAFQAVLDNSKAISVTESEINIFSQGVSIFKADLPSKYKYYLGYALYGSNILFGYSDENKNSVLLDVNLVNGKTISKSVALIGYQANFYQKSDVFYYAIGSRNQKTVKVFSRQESKDEIIENKAFAPENYANYFTDVVEISPIELMWHSKDKIMLEIISANKGNNQIISVAPFEEKPELQVDVFDIPVDFDGCSFKNVIYLVNRTEMLIDVIPRHNLARKYNVDLKQFGYTTNQVGWFDCNEAYQAIIIPVFTGEASTDLLFIDGLKQSPDSDIQSRMKVIAKLNYKVTFTKSISNANYIIVSWTTSNSETPKLFIRFDYFDNDAWRFILKDDQTLTEDRNFSVKFKSTLAENNDDFSSSNEGNFNIMSKIVVNPTEVTVKPVSTEKRELSKGSFYINNLVDVSGSYIVLQASDDEGKSSIIGTVLQRIQKSGEAASLQKLSRNYDFLAVLSDLRNVVKHSSDLEGVRMLVSDSKGSEEVQIFGSPTSIKFSGKNPICRDYLFNTFSDEIQGFSVNTLEATLQKSGDDKISKVFTNKIDQEYFFKECRYTELNDGKVPYILIKKVSGELEGYLGDIDPANKTTPVDSTKISSFEIFSTVLKKEEMGGITFVIVLYSSIEETMKYSEIFKIGNDGKWTSMKKIDHSFKKGVVAKSLSWSRLLAENSAIKENFLSNWFILSSEGQVKKITIHFDPENKSVVTKENVISLIPKSVPIAVFSFSRYIYIESFRYINSEKVTYLQIFDQRVNASQFCRGGLQIPFKSYSSGTQNLKIYEHLSDGEDTKFTIVRIESDQVIGQNYTVKSQGEELIIRDTTLDKPLRLLQLSFLTSLPLDGESTTKRTLGKITFDNIFKLKHDDSGDSDKNKWMLYTIFGLAVVILVVAGIFYKFWKNRIDGEINEEQSREDYFRNEMSNEKTASLIE